MASRRSKNADSERLDDASIERAIKYLEEKGSTKKNACQILNISYNTARLDKIINDYITKKERDAQRRKEKRGKPASPEEINYVISEYLAGAPISEIAKSVYRGPTFVHNILEAYAVPERNQSQDYFHPKLIPDEACREEFAIGETVYSARYDTLASIEALVQDRDNIKVYRIWLKGDWKQYASQPAFELASLAKLKELGVAL